MTLQVYINDKTAYFYPDSTYQINSPLGVRVILTDINHDGSLDMIVVNPGFAYPNLDRFSGLQVFLNDGNGHLTNSQNFYIPGIGANQIFSNDYNNDGKTDFALFNTVSGSSIVTGDNTGNLSLMNMVHYGGGENSGTLITGDMNGDNRIDLIFDPEIVGAEGGDSADASFSIFLNSQVDPFSSYLNIKGFPLGQLYKHAYGAPVLGDVNNDGALDLVHGLYSGYTTILINTDSVNSIKDKYSLTDFSLGQNYPNPFNPSTTINYSLPISGNVKLTIYNSIGSKVATLVNEYKPAGTYSVNFNASNLASGIYLYRLESGTYSAAKKLILIK
jgi:hypothetical protein